MVTKTGRCWRLGRRVSATLMCAIRSSGGGWHMKGAARVLGSVALGLALLATAARAQSSWPRPLNVGVGLSFSRSP